MKIYVVSSWKNVSMVRSLTDYLRRNGHEVDDFTDDSRGRYVFHWSEVGDIQELDAINFLKDRRAQRAFEEDKKWIDWADAVILVLPAGRSAHLEAGYAKGKGKLLVILGEFPKGEFDVMYGFADLLTRDHEEVKRFLKPMCIGLSVCGGGCDSCPAN
ncbi:hypothetical protein [Desulforamulus ruminis]|uniref:Nucleoside 2-deoxyribosyltransferase n=1 Tax=Desulforamulus ruminis (strain ATCC 23193 / DSM 2154 / NCIMB 8452 / DL) TaxID=696281 RepID=F6DTH4_DESRL|nr:hypothetical protein [Desulforamulus ruminis]AEG60036.1 hypothetical protein Desru_1772 [Desulforamulus ruminis DSM 2154]